MYTRQCKDSPFLRNCSLYIQQYQVNIKILLGQLIVIVFVRDKGCNPEYFYRIVRYLKILGLVFVGTLPSGHHINYGHRLNFAFLCTLHFDTNSFSLSTLDWVIKHHTT